MTRISNISRTRKIATVVAVLGMLGGGIALATGTSNAAESCQGLDTALQNNLNFIAGQQANPDANSAGRIANRQAVVDLIQQRRQAAGCTGDIAAQPAAGNQNRQNSGESCAGLDKALQNNLNFIAGQQANPDANSAARIANRQAVNRQAVVDLIEQRRQAAGCNDGADENNADEQGNDGANGDADQADEGQADQGQADEDQADQGDDAAAGDVVCQGSTVTLSGEGGAPAASSNQFPIGTQLKVTNLDNNKSTTVEVTSVSGSCALLNNAAFEQVREPGKFLIRRAVIERVG
jgi:cobalamin biosynthesis protein CobT